MKEYKALSRFRLQTPKGALTLCIFKHILFKAPLGVWGNMRTKFFIGTLLIICLIFVSCEKNQVTPQAAPDNCNMANITYTNTIQYIISYDCAYTTGCHAAGSSYPNLTTYADLKEYVVNGSLYEQLFILKAMPPAPQPLLDNCTQAQIQAWINAGAPQ